MPAFTEDELAIIKTLRSCEIRVTPDGRLEVWFPVSDEACAAELHKLLRPTVE